MLNLKKIGYQFYNERDLEIPAILDFVKEHPDVVTALDVGCHWSWSYYAPEIRKMLSNYDGLDLLADSQTAAIIDKYWQINVLDFENRHYDLVMCISSLEHAGISTYKIKDYKLEQQEVFAKLLELSKKYLFLTFPYGKEALHKGQFANITKEQFTVLSRLVDIWGKTKEELHFYFSEFPQGKKLWEEVDMEFANEVEYKSELGTRCLCIWSLEK